jgi:hypothetical protein
VVAGEVVSRRSSTQGGGDGSHEEQAGHQEAEAVERRGAGVSHGSDEVRVGTGKAKKRMLMSMATVAVGSSNKPRPAQARRGELVRPGADVEVFMPRGRRRRRGFDMMAGMSTRTSGLAGVDLEEAMTTKH